MTRRSRDLLVEPLALERGDGFRVADPGDVAIGVEHDCRRHDRTRQTSAPDLVHAGDRVEPHPPDGVLERAKRADFDHG